MKTRRSMSGSSQQPSCLTGVAADCFWIFSSRRLALLANVALQSRQFMVQEVCALSSQNDLTAAIVPKSVPFEEFVFLTFFEVSRNALPNLAEYLGERPDMTSHGGKPRKANTMKGNNTYENKIS